MNKREHWTKRRHRFDEQHRCVYYSWVSQAKWPPRLDPWPRPFLVTLTRIGPRVLDDDNLASGFKQVRDSIAGILGIDDGSAEIRFLYKQERGKAREYAVRVEIEMGEADGKMDRNAP